MSSLRSSSLFQAAKQVLWNAGRIPLYFGGVLALSVLIIKVENNIASTGLSRITGIVGALLILLVGLGISFSGLSINLVESLIARQVGGISAGGKKSITIEIKTSDGKLIAKGLDPADVNQIIRALTEGTKHGS